VPGGYFSHRGKVRRYGGFGGQRESLGGPADLRGDSPNPPGMCRVRNRAARPERPFPAYRGYAHPSAYVRFEVLRHVAEELGATPNQVVLAWMLHQDPVVIPLFGASSPGQLAEALDAVDIHLNADQLTRLNNA
jgi:aryl-alcohol dehydrogenase-like predicted oxidoreductase